MNPNENPNIVNNGGSPVENNPIPTMAPVAPAPVAPAAPVVPTEPVVTPVQPAPPVMNPVSVQAPPPVNPQPSGVGNDPNTIVNQNLKTVEVNYTPPSKAKTILLVIFFVLLIGFVVFLPEISTFIENYQANKNQPDVEKITTGRMKCSLSTSTTNLDKNLEFVFRFTDNKLEKFEYTVMTRGDATLDEKTLDELATTCKQLASETESISGVTIQCEYMDSSVTEIQTFELKDIDQSKLDAAYTEAGGTHPEFPYGQDMDVIEKTMNASGYTCKREQ